jgi:hypothetical protein
MIFALQIVKAAVILVQAANLKLVAHQFHLFFQNYRFIPAINFVILNFNFELPVFHIHHS